VKRYYRATLPFALGGFMLCAAAQQATAPQAQTTQPPKEAAPPAPAAGQAQSGLPVFRGQATEVELPVTVTDDRGKFVSDLTRDDFRVLDEGRTQRIAFFSHSEKQPVVLGFLVDLSSAAKTQWDKYKEAAKELIWTLLPDDPLHSGYLITYTHEAVLSVDTTIHGEELTQRLDKIKPGGGSALYDAIYMACRGRKKVEGEPTEPRRVIIVIGDGHDNNSSHTLDQVLEIAKRDQVTIFGLSTVPYEMDNEASDVLNKLATETGGVVRNPLSNPFKDLSGYISTPMDAGNYQYEAGTGGYASAIAKAIVDSVASLQGEITTQYVLRYIPDIDPETASKEYRRIKVEIPSLPNARVRAREGYYPFAPPTEYTKPARPIGIAVPTAAKPASPPPDADAAEPKPSDPAKP
jgi:Ca-activated chloride channel family protein